MTAAEFSRLVEQPSLLRDANAADLRDLASRYPFCASVHLLLLKKYQVDKHADFDARLAQTAAYANDRKALYRLLYDESKFKQTEEAPEVGTHEQRVGTEIMLGNESGAFADYTPKNRVAEIETYETIEFNAVGEVEGLRELENENSDRISFELQEQFILANTAAGGGSEISTDFQDLEEDRDEEPLEEDQDAEIESMKILENVGSISLENGLVETDGMYNLTEVRSTNGIGKHHDFDSSVEIENEAFDSKLELAWSETSFDTTRDTPTKPSEDIPGEAVPEQQREMPADPMEHSNVEREESPSPKEQDAVEPEEEITLQPQQVESEQFAHANDTFEPSPELANLLDKEENDEASDRGNSIQLETELKQETASRFSEIPEEESAEHTTYSNAQAAGSDYEETLIDGENASVETTSVNDFSNQLSGTQQDELAETELAEGESSHDQMSDNDQTLLQEIIEQSSQPTSVEEHEVTFDAKSVETENESIEVTSPSHVNDSKQEPTDTEETESLTPDLTPRQEINVPIAEEDVVGETHLKISEAAAAPYRDEDSQQPVQRQTVAPEGTRSFTDWLRTFKNPSDARPESEQKPGTAFHEPVAETKLDSNRAAAKKQPPAPSAEDVEADALYDREWQARKIEMESWTSGLPDELKVIDEFVSQHSSHQPVSRSGPSVAELAQRSLETSDEFVTETMAKVYAAQGKYKKAAEVIEKLMLKYPAKRLYFADLLNEFKKKITLP